LKIPNFLRRGRPLPAPAAILFLGLVLTAQAEDPGRDSAGGTPPAEPAPATYDIPIPIGQTSSGVVVQNMDIRGNDLGVMKAREATRINEQEVELGDLRMKLLGTPDKPQEMNITVEKAVFNMKTSILRSRSRVHIQRKDFDLYGDAMEYNTLTGEAQIFGDVNMIIHDAEKVISPGPSPEGAASKEGAAPSSLAMP
jgi:hypothetical protein